MQAWSQDTRGECRENSKLATILLLIQEVPAPLTSIERFPVAQNNPFRSLCLQDDYYQWETRGWLDTDNLPDQCQVKARNSVIPGGVSRLFDSSAILQGRKQDQGDQRWNSSKETVMIDLFPVSPSFLCSPSLEGQGVPLKPTLSAPAPSLVAIWTPCL